MEDDLIPPIENPGPVSERFLEPFDAGDPDVTGPMPGSLLSCGCHVRRPDYEAVLCDEHLAELNGGR
ncbi:hypothetical protein [Tsukamurella tyrosinosolvens]|uniref:Uncharacterized protein n=1 Tax=Tsukamurella tyrosinosolvens TaxID=57704 RepID=A0A1H4VK42_TSUTY|nr:hypothetical protein [Tsukamurella tyrosinosolvens]KXO90957.1 hypothetical protein AXK58_21220 [Tsukamurella tyrosinosolvens]SEC81210.1 hypothetical protein SAMN04489793_3250 [Tsukamurella tyrosinosolvens]